MVDAFTLYFFFVIFVVKIPFQMEHNAYPALDWQRWAVSRMCREATYRQHWLEKSISYARYGQIPVGNLPEDVTIYLADVCFSRQVGDRKLVQFTYLLGFVSAIIFMQIYTSIF